jgi:hypothetical protein
MFGSGGGTVAHAARSSNQSTEKKVVADFLMFKLIAADWYCIEFPIFESCLILKSVAESSDG